tara:strand:+ start:256 stop:639 length:384 start_codon:yes stop_codon:yes gene_type:complete
MFCWEISTAQCVPRERPRSAPTKAIHVNGQTVELWLRKPTRQRDIKTLLQRRVPACFSTQLLCEPLVMAHNLHNHSWEDIITLLEHEAVPCQDDMWVSSDDSCDERSSESSETEAEDELQTDDEDSA